MTSEVIVEGVVAQIATIRDPLGRLAVLDELSRTVLPAVFDQMIDTAGEIREAGGTWRTIGESLGVTPQAAQARFSESGRSRNAERNRGRRSESGEV